MINGGLKPPLIHITLYSHDNPFTLLLENHGYNKSTNSIDVQGDIKDIGIFGRPDVQNVLNRFMKDNDDVIVTI